MSDTTWVHKETVQPSFDVNIFHINAEQMTEIYAYFGNRIFDGRYNIGYWHWELSDFPDIWLDGFSFLQEVWVPSTFVADSIALKSPVPVVKIGSSPLAMFSDQNCSINFQKIFENRTRELV
ncbi:hypothetical protein BG53_07455 [Paenibacillus darwinianus]|uniref:Neurotransmitter-gated ion-channel ligand-binding domain-containing protein n=2 Tax=Paenibacillus darwinianus TaxID=1380763 RepID=A0A9W5RZA2_9BACL|nr:hypothetical protein BG53_07455 [Paenibacillus darwinianus]